MCQVRRVAITDGEVAVGMESRDLRRSKVLCRVIGTSLVADKSVAAGKSTLLTAAFRVRLMMERQ
jgi:hypothetical protein